MKTVCLLAFAALASAHARVPVIELNLAGIRPTFAVRDTSDPDNAKLEAVAHSSSDCKCLPPQGVQSYTRYCQNKKTGQCEPTGWHNTCHEDTVDCRTAQLFDVPETRDTPFSLSRSDLLTKNKDADFSVATNSQLTPQKDYANNDDISKVRDFAKKRVRLTKVARQIVRKHDMGYTQPNGDKVRSVQDYTQRCPADPDTKFDNCPFPVAKAWDHNEQQISVKTRVFRVDLDGSSCNYDDTNLRSTCGCTGGDSKTCLVGSVNFQQRSTYLFKYDAQDAAGNHAEQVVFALIIDDQVAPAIKLCGKDNQDKRNRKCFALDEQTPCADNTECLKDSEFRVPRGCAAYNEACYNEAAIDVTQCPPDQGEWQFTNEREIVQAGSSWKLCNNFEIEDVVDGDLKESALFDVQKKNAKNGAWEYQQDAFNTKFSKAREVIDVSTGPAEYIVTMKVCDNAGVYGKDSMSNCARAVKAIKVIDTARPVIVLHGELGEPDPEEYKTWTEVSKEKGGTYERVNPKSPLVVGVAGCVPTAEWSIYEKYTTICAEFGVDKCGASWAVSGSEYTSRCEWHAKPHNVMIVHHECNSHVCTAGAPDECFLKEDACTRAGIHDQVRFRRASAWTSESDEARNAKNCADFENYCKEHADYCHGYELEMASGFDVMDTFLNPDKLGPMDVKHTSTVKASEVGDYAIEYELKDASANVAFPKKRLVKVVDTIPPILRTNGDEGNIEVWYDKDDAVTSVDQQVHDSHKSGEGWVDPGATCTDMCDKSDIEVEAKWVVCPGGTNPGSTDKALKDVSADWGQYVKSEGRDTLTPWPGLGNCTGLSEDGADNQLLGTYIRLYRCSDKMGNYAWGSRKWAVIDNSRPRITLLGDGKETYDASKKVEYTDKGATCIDDVDGTLSSAVEVSGSVVDMSEVGSYKLRYDCQDKSGNQAEPMFRTVYVEDKSCPELKLKGEEVNYVEAGFNWTDPEYTATDDLDGDITNKVVVSGDTVDTSAAFYHRRSCKDIKVNYEHEAKSEPSNGFYYITTVTRHRLKVYCDFKYDATYYVCDGKNTDDPHYTDAKGAIMCQTDAAASCQKLGLEKVAWSSEDQKTAASLITEIRQFVHDDSVVTDQYLCSTNDESKIIKWSTVPSMYEEGAENEHGIPTDASRMAHNLIHSAEVGKYVIRYSVMDAAGNSECGGPKKRTVIVRDTLPPIISLHLKTKLDNSADRPFNNRRGKDGKDLIHIGDTTSMGLGDGVGKRNSNSDKHALNPDVSLMAETTQSSNVWLVAAAASAVTGLALLGFSRREQVAAVDV